MGWGHQWVTNLIKFSKVKKSEREVVTNRAKQKKLPLTALPRGILSRIK